MSPEQKPRIEAVIETVRFEPESWSPPGPVRVLAGLDDGGGCELFKYYSDELSFTAEELIGKTVEAARALHHQRDRSHLDA